MRAPHVVVLLRLFAGHVHNAYGICYCECTLLIHLDSSLLPSLQIIYVPTDPASGVVRDAPPLILWHMAAVRISGCRLKTILDGRVPAASLLSGRQG
jgi:hypothetical protein